MELRLLPVISMRIVQSMHPVGVIWTRTYPVVSKHTYNTHSDHREQW